MIIGTAVVVMMCFGLVVFVGPPYLPTLAPQVKVALDMLDLKPGETMLELGCGDGKVVVAAAQRGWNVIGIELNPMLVIVCKLRTWRYRKQVKIVLGNYWDIQKWGRAEAIFGFVLPKYMTKLDKLIEDWRSGPIKLASFAFKIPGKKIDREQAGVFLYLYDGAKSA